MMRKLNITTRINCKKMEIDEYVLGMILSNNGLDTCGLDEEC